MNQIGYAGVSRVDQNPQYQHDALTAAGCAEIFEDRVSGAEFSQADLDQALAALVRRRGTRCVELDRLGRSKLDTVKIVLDLDRSGVGFLSLTESLDTKAPLSLVSGAILA
jgi:DNA invertase Pin-like site-specific DNA recombinase